VEGQADRRRFRPKRRSGIVSVGREKTGRISFITFEVVFNEQLEWLQRISVFRRRDIAGSASSTSSSILAIGGYPLGIRLPDLVYRRYKCEIAICGMGSEK